MAATIASAASSVFDTPLGPSILGAAVTKGVAQVNDITKKKEDDFGLLDDMMTSTRDNNVKPVNLIEGEAGVAGVAGDDDDDDDVSVSEGNDTVSDLQGPKVPPFKPRNKIMSVAVAAQAADIMSQAAKKKRDDAPDTARNQNATVEVIDSRRIYPEARGIVPSMGNALMRRDDAKRFKPYTLYRIHGLEVCQKDKDMILKTNAGERKTMMRGCGMFAFLIVLLIVLYFTLYMDASEDDVQNFSNIAKITMTACASLTMLFMNRYSSLRDRTLVDYIKIAADDMRDTNKNMAVTK